MNEILNVTAVCIALVGVGLLLVLRRSIRAIAARIESEIQHRNGMERATIQYLDAIQCSISEFDGMRAKEQTNVGARVLELAHAMRLHRLTDPGVNGGSVVFPLGTVRTHGKEGPFELADNVQWPMVLRRIVVLVGDPRTGETIDPAGLHVLVARCGAQLLFGGKAIPAALFGVHDGTLFSNAPRFDQVNAMVGSRISVDVGFERGQARDWIVSVVALGERPREVLSGDEDSFSNARARRRQRRREEHLAELEGPPGSVWGFGTHVGPSDNIVIDRTAEKAFVIDYFLIIAMGDRGTLPSGCQTAEIGIESVELEMISTVIPMHARPWVKGPPIRLERDPHGRWRAPNPPFDGLPFMCPAGVSVRLMIRTNHSLPRATVEVTAVGMMLAGEGQDSGLGRETRKVAMTASSHGIERSGEAPVSGPDGASPPGGEDPGLRDVRPKGAPQANVTGASPGPREVSSSGVKRIDDHMTTSRCPDAPPTDQRHDWTYRIDDDGVPLWECTRCGAARPSFGGAGGAS